MNSSICHDKDSGWLFHLLEFCDKSTRDIAICLSQRYRQILTTEASFKWRLKRLHIEEGVFVPIREIHRKNTQWKSKYLKFKKRSGMWKINSNQNQTDNTSLRNNTSNNIVSTSNEVKDNFIMEDSEKFHVQVCVRLRPTLNGDLCYKTDLKNRATLPLHQRLQLIKIDNKLTSNKQALRVLKDRGEWFKEKWDEENEKDINEATKAKQEQLGLDDDHLRCGIHSVDCEKNNIFIVDSTKGLKKFNFDCVLPESSDQSYVYENSVTDLVGEFMNGVNTSCLVYGMTGSGKTYTMFGPSYTGTDYRRNYLGAITEGIVPRACREIFDAIEYRTHALNLKIVASVSVQYVEIYGNEILDLLNEGSLCGKNKASSHRFVLHGKAAEVPVRDFTDICKLLDIGERRKRKATTAMNQRSSRAHSIFILSMKQVCMTTDVERASQFFMVDLGGCEQTKKSNIESGLSKHWDIQREKRQDQNIVSASQSDSRHIDGNINRREESAPSLGSRHRSINEYSIGFVKSDRMREAVYINLGLMALKSCVRALNDNNENTYIPYAQSKLTMMLSKGLGKGENRKTCVIVCAAQEEEHSNETISALRFGQACRNIDQANDHRDEDINNNTKNKIVEALLSKIDADISHCENLIREKEKWEIREEHRLDTLAELGTLESQGFGGVETKKTTVLVGAEAEHKRLNELVRQRLELVKNHSNLSFETKDNSSEGVKYGGNYGFGAAYKYGFGESYFSSKSAIMLAHNKNLQDGSNSRFESEIDVEDIPRAVRKRGGLRGWKTGDDLSGHEKENLSETSNSVNRNNLVYSGISA